MSTPPDATVPPSSFDGADSHSLAKCPYPSFTSLLSNPSKRISIPNLSSLSPKMSLLRKNHSHSQCTSMYHSFADSIHPPTPFAVHLRVEVVRIKCVTTNHPCLRPFLMSPALRGKQTKGTPKCLVNTSNQPHNHHVATKLFCPTLSVAL